MRRPLRVAVLALVVIVVAGCDLLFGMAYPWAGYPEPWDDEPFPEPTVLATYSEGTATVEITRDGTTETVTFDRVGEGSTLNGLLGASVTWRNDDGWVLTLNSYDYSADVTLQRINGLDFWRADSWGLNGMRCVVDMDDATATAIRGTASCYGLRWSDGLMPPYQLEPPYIEGEPPFDAEFTFEALP